MIGSGNSAYKKQTYETCTRLAKAGHWVGHIPMGRCNRMAEIMIDGVLVLKSGIQIFCEDIIHYYATKYRADIVITLKEEWVFMAPPHGLPGSALAWCPFNIIDHEPLSPAITSRILTAFKTISPSRHSQRLVTGAGIDADYIPHGISCSDFHILEGMKAECKKLWLSRFTQKPEEDFTILVGPARNQARKMLPIQLRGIARFYEQNPDAARHSHVILWTDVRSASRAETEEASLLGFATQGADLLPEIVNLGILDHVVQLSEELIAYGVPDWAGDKYGVGGEDLCKLYNAADVELNCTLGDTTVLCNAEPKMMAEIHVGDKVLTHTGDFKPVTHIFKRPYEGEVFEVEPMYGLPVTLTPEHPVLAIKTHECDMRKGSLCRPDCSLVSWNLMNKKHKLDSPRVTKYFEAQKLRKEHGLGYRSIAKKLDMKESTISSWIYGKGRPWGLHNQSCSHKVYKQYRPEWVLAKDLQERDLVLFPRPNNIVDLKEIRVSDYVDVILENGLCYRRGRNQYDKIFKHSRSKPITDSVPLNEDILRLFGYYIAEGFPNKSGIGFALNQSENDITDDIRSIMLKYFSLKIHVNDNPKTKQRKVNVYSATLEPLFKALFGEGARNKRMPDWMFKLPNQKIYSVIYGLWRGDGWLSKSRKKGEYATSSKTLAHQIWMILGRLGFLSSIKYMKSKRAYRIRVSGKSAGNFFKKVGYSYELPEGNRTYSNGWLDDKYLYFSVRKITKKEYCGTVYNLAVEDDESYTSYFNIHNCTGGECVGMTQIEASASGTPVIATDYAGGAEHVGPGLTVRQDGYMVLGSGGHRYAVPSVDGIAEALKKMYNTDREKLGRKARRWSTRFDWDNVMPFWDKWLDKVEQELRPRVTKGGIRKWD